MDNSRDWATRCVHEASLYEENTYVTLTYAPEHLPDDKSLNPRHFQLFMKKLRKAIAPRKIRFFHCGEYGEKLHRPHYHALIFNYQFPDLVYFTTRNGNKLYTSEMLSGIWEKGHCTIGQVTWQSAAYVARYIMKKITGEIADEHYRFVDEETGEIFQVRPEYTTMSNREGIGHDWYQLYKNEVFPSDFIIMNGAKQKPPRYYAKLYERENAAKAATLKAERVKAAKRRKDDATPDRLAVRETVKSAQLSTLKRRYEEAK